MPANEAAGHSTGATCPRLDMYVPCYGLSFYERGKEHVQAALSSQVIVACVASRVSKNKKIITRFDSFQREETVALYVIDNGHVNVGSKNHHVTGEWMDGGLGEPQRRAA